MFLVRELEKDSQWAFIFSAVTKTKNTIKFAWSEQSLFASKSSRCEDQIETRLRPFARRALRTFRPPLVAIRARKP
jgi:hypothetical protein